MLISYFITETRLIYVLILATDVLVFVVHSALDCCRSVPCGLLMGHGTIMSSAWTQ